MRSTKVVLLGALSLLGLAGCNMGQPRLYRVAIDESPLKTIKTPTCYRNSNLPGGPSDVDTYRAEKEWVIWNGVSGKEYLDLGTLSYKLGDSPTITVLGLIEGDGAERSFAAVRTEARPAGDLYTEQRQMQIAVKFDDYSASPVGTVSLQSTYACSNNRASCPTGDQAPPDAASCNAVLNFVARRIDVTNGTSYNNNP